MQTLLSTRFLTLLVLMMLCTTSFGSAEDSSPQAAINRVLDDFHQAAAEADQERYLGHFATGGVFMGTDDWERWPLPAFTAYVNERFAGGTGWTYVPQQRFVTMGPRGDSAWFDEIVISKRWGRFRGTGVLLEENGVWKIAHYSLTALVPNERFEDVARLTTAGFEARAPKATTHDD